MKMSPDCGACLSLNSSCENRGGILPISAYESSSTHASDFSDGAFAALVACKKNTFLLNHLRCDEVVHPVLRVSLLAEEGRELCPVPDPVKQGVNEDLAPAGSEGPRTPRRK